MKYGLVFGTLGAALALQAATHRGPWLVLVWPAVSFGLVALAYLGLGPRVFGKRPDGTMAWPAIAALLPYLLLNWLVWHAAQILTREECFNEVVPGLFVGRRPLAGEVPKEVTTIVDLTAEFPECRDAKCGRRYLSLPMLDAGIANTDAFLEIAEQAAESRGAVFIHCAQGHGRTGTLAAAVLVVGNHSATVDEAIERLREARPRLRLSRRQTEFVMRALANRSAE